MAKTKLEIISDITNYFKSIPFSVCYVGITSDAESRLFGDHYVSKENGHWIYRTAVGSEVSEVRCRVYTLHGLI
jgi:hypothetical protein